MDCKEKDGVRKKRKERIKYADIGNNSLELA